MRAHPRASRPPCNRRSTSLIRHRPTGNEYILYRLDSRCPTSDMSLHGLHPNCDELMPCPVAPRSSRELKRPTGTTGLTHAESESHVSLLSPYERVVLEQGMPRLVFPLVL